jgi:hypothetical protein
MAGARELPQGWLYLPNVGSPCASTPSFFLRSEEMPEDLDDVPASAVAAGFPREGLDTHSIENTFKAAQQFDRDPSDALLVESFVYYWRFDAYLPKPNAPDPPPPDVSRLIQERKFYDSLGPERLNTKCRAPDCSRGTVKFSVHCRVHHFEQIWNRACPFRH